MSNERRRQLRDFMDEMDRYFEEFERSVEEALRSPGSEDAFSKPFVAGFSMEMGPEGRPTFQFFGDDLEKRDEGYRTPVYEQVVDEKLGKLRLLVELPGVEKQDIKISAVEDSAEILVEDEERKYRVEIPLKRDVNPDSSRATFNNGLLDVAFSLKDKTNKGYRTIRVV